MNKVPNEVIIARRRLCVAAGLRALPWVLVLCFSVCFLALLIPKITYLPYTYASWSRLWFMGAACAAMVLTIVVAVVRRPSLSVAALEVDKRYQLQERLSSLLALPEAERETAAAMALQRDTQLKLDRLDVRDKFPMQMSKNTPWVLLPLILCIGLSWVPDVSQASLAALSPEAKQRLENVKQRTAPILTQVKTLREEIDKQELKEVSEDLKKIERRLEEMQNKQNLEPKEMLSDFNAIKKEIEERKETLKSTEDLKKAMADLESLEKGPGEKMANALKNGEIEDAKAELQKLKDELKKGSLSDDDKKQLAKQLEQIHSAIEQKVHEQQNKVEELKKELEKAEASGDIEQAASLRKQVEQAENALQKAKNAAASSKSMADAASALRNGDASSAQASLDDLEKALDGMAASDAAMQELENVLDDLQNAKQSANCQSCSGGGCSKCNGGSGSGKGSKQARQGTSSKAATGSKSSQAVKGAGKGPGQGDGSATADPADEIETSEYDDRVDGFNRNTEQRFGGKVRGPNRPGMTLEEAREAISNSTPEDPEAAENIPLPRAEREQQKEYFERLRNR